MDGAEEGAGAVTLRLPTASGIDRADHCPPSQWLPGASTESVYASLGQGVHDFIVRWREYLGKDRDAALAEIDEDAPHRALCEALPLEAIPEGGKLEVAFAYDPETDTARILGYNIGRAYREHGALPHEVCGTADLMGTADGVLVIIDWKSGFGIVPKWQLRFLALAGCRALGLTRAKVCNWFLRENGTIIEDQDSVDEFDAFDLDQIAEELRGVLARLRAAHAAAGPEPSLRGGSWCQYCECKPHCALQTGLAKRSLGMKLAEPMTPERAMQAWLMFEMLEDLAAAGKAGLREYARQHPFPDGQGNVIKQVERESTKLIPEKALPALREEFTAELAEAACERKLTQASLERALRAKNMGKPLAPLKRQAMKAMAARGGVVVGKRLEVRPVKDGKAPTAALQLGEDGSILPLVLTGG
jgi:hypothetical protein